MKLGFDLDEVVVDLTSELCDYLAIRYGIEWSVDDFINYGFYDCCFDIDPEVNKSIASSVLERANDAEFQFQAAPVEGACEVLNKLKKAGHTLHFITSRPKQNQPWTFKWLRKYDIPFDSVDVIGHSEHKGLYGRKLDLDMYVDDLERHLVSMLTYKKRWRKGLILLDKPWNSANYDGSKFIKLNNWQEILRHVGVQNR